MRIYGVGLDYRNKNRIRRGKGEDVARVTPRKGRAELGLTAERMVGEI